MSLNKLLYCIEHAIKCLILIGDIQIDCVEKHTYTFFYMDRKIIIVDQ